VDPIPMVDGCIADVCQCNKEGRQNCHCDAVAQYSRLCMAQTEVVPSWRKPTFCPITCPNDMVYSECASSCPRTCHNLVTPDTECHEHCVDGCTCPEGRLLHDGRCVQEDECSCLHNGREFPAGHVLNQECQNCICSSAVWNCTDIPCPAECSAVGDPHYKTFDGHMYTMHGECQYTFSKDCSSTSLFSVIVDNTVCGIDSTVTCTKDVTIVLRTGLNHVFIRFSKGQVTSVDGKAVMPPYVRERFQIFKVSSDFVQLRTDIGIVVDWDGISRVYVKAERRWQGKLCGLCGNYNRNQRDDFMNFNGLVERSPVSFGNAWKASPDCIDMTTQFIQDPCQVNQQRVGFATTECQIILGETFSACHNDVSPQPYFDLCRYDVCECEDAEACLCNTISHYARVCAQAGHVTEWRMPNFCNRECSGGQIYRECSSTCHSTCRSISDQSVRCDESCVQGCNCPDGLYLSEEGSCVKREQCECYHNGRSYRAFEVIHREFTTCHCMEGRLTCVDIINEDRSNDLFNRTSRNALCPFGQIYKSCNISEGNPTGIECQQNCKNYGEDCFAQSCAVGCACPSGQVFDNERSVCIHANDCPCYYGGQAYLPGHSVTIDCNRCECRNREWECTHDDCVGSCNAYGDPHYETFDGFTFNYMGTCNYILTQDYCDHRRGTFRVHVENTLCGSDGMACTKACSILPCASDYPLNIQIEAESMVTWGPSPGSDTNHTNVVWDYHHVGLYTIVTTDIGLMVVWDRKTTVIVKLDPRYMGRVCGLCGNFDGNQNNDAMKKADRKSLNYPIFIIQTSPNCDNTPPMDDPCTLHPNRKPWAQRSCNILQSEIFQPCHALVDVTWYYSNCRFDACGCDGGADCECFCVAVAAYARACAEAGRPIKWRSPNVCPLMCEAYNTDSHDCTWHYSECQTACPVTCQHRYLSNAVDQCSLSIACVEGCFPRCPEGTLYDEHTRRCTSQCRKGCHTNGRFYGIGDVVTEDECHICTCSLLESVECTTAKKCQPPPKEHVLSVPSVARYCDGAVNLVFLVQSTDHVSAHEYHDVKKLIETYVSAIAPSSYGTDNTTLRVAIQQYSDRLEYNLALDDHQNMSILLNAVNDLELQRGSANQFNEALRSAITQFNISEKASNASVENVLFAITFTTPQEDVSEVVRELENLNIKAIILSITHHGHGRYPEERTLHSYEIEELSDIFTEQYNNMAMSILNEICEVVPGVSTSTPVVPGVSTSIPVVPGVSTSTPVVPGAVGCRIDLELVVDSSYSIGVEGFITLKKMLGNLIQKFDINNDQTRVGLMQYSKRSQVEWFLSTFPANLDGMLNKIEQMQMLQGVTYTYHALEHVLQTVIDGSDPGRRPDVPFVVVLITDGRAKVKFSKSSNDIQVVAIVVPNDELEELELLQESVGDKAHVILSQDFSQLTDNLEELKQHICGVSSTTIGTVNVFFTDCSSMPPTDILFILDGSQGIDTTAGRYYKEMLESVAAPLAIGPNNTQVDKFVYGRDPYINFGMEDHSSTIEVEEAMNDLHHIGSAVPANVGKALKFVLNNVTVSHPRQGTNDIRQTILLLIGRDSFDDLKHEIEAARLRGVEVITFFIGGIHVDNPSAFTTVPDGFVPVHRLRELNNLETRFLRYYAKGVVHMVLDSECDSRHVPQVTTTNEQDKCRYYVCSEDGSMTFRDKRLMCDETRKPTCQNGFEPVLYYDADCECQWQCQCYCTIAADPGYHTFDGALTPLTQFKLGEEEDLPMKIFHSTDSCDPKHSDVGACIADVTVQLSNVTFHLRNDLSVARNDVVLKLPHEEMIHGYKVQLQVIGIIKLLLTVSDLGLEVKYVPAVHYVTISLPAHRCANKTEGMCGDCNGVSSNDMVMRNHMLTQEAVEFGYSWNFPKPEPLNQHCIREPDPLCLKISEGEEFARCRSVVDYKSYYIACRNETCSKNYPACDWLAAFAEACRHGGVCVRWRTDTACAMRCPAGRVYDACRHEPYEKSCTKPSTLNKINEVVEGCFLNCSADEVVVDGACRSNKICTTCFDAEAGVHRKAGEKWVPSLSSCRECECDSNTLKIKCGERKCSKKVSLPVCGDCEIPRVSGPDPCCPIQQHCDCDRNCNALRPQCLDGEQEKRLTSEPGCRPVYRCECDRNLCTERRIICETPKVLVEVPTSCCPLIKCVCPKCPNHTEVQCETGFSKRTTTDICNCTHETCEKLPVCLATVNQTLVTTNVGDWWLADDNPCTNCTCARTEVGQLQVKCTDLSKSCSCPAVDKSIYYSNQCCPQCVVNRCEYIRENGTDFYEVGEEWSADVEGCLRRSCEEVAGIATIRKAAAECDDPAPSDCSTGFKSVCEKESCCVQCRCSKCTVHLTCHTIQRPGDNFNINECTRCNCTEEIGADGFHVSQCLTTHCKPCLPGFILAEVMGSCCGLCKPERCSLSLPFHGENKTQMLEVMKLVCSQYKCIADSSGYAVVVATDVFCPQVNITRCIDNGGVVVYDDDGCCAECKFMTCQATKSEPKTLSISGCETDRPVELAYCHGECASGSHYHEITGDFVKHCTCCSATDYYNMSIPATCGNGTQV
uniref:von Willebrand factor n=1 Tax=Ciona savignyi TaxID=51511 RepID=H2YMM4_CIOSA